MKGEQVIPALFHRRFLGLKKDYKELVLLIFSY